ncbi:MAG: hypothetical protein PHQ75_00435 [Thermoguttaceae bacterium]|nr:hypothetical protein [Thermoguttaceae bacterium]
MKTMRYYKDDDLDQSSYKNSDSFTLSGTLNVIVNSDAELIVQGEYGMVLKNPVFYHCADKLYFLNTPTSFYEVEWNYDKLKRTVLSLVNIAFMPQADGNDYAQTTYPVYHVLVLPREMKRYFDNRYSLLSQTNNFSDRVCMNHSSDECDNNEDSDEDCEQVFGGGGEYNKGNTFAFSPAMGQLDRCLDYSCEVIKRFNEHGTDYAIVNANNHYLLISSFDHPGSWQADEMAFNGMEPLWFSGILHYVSPLTQNMKMRKRLEKCIDRKIDSLVVYNDNVEIINMDDMKQVWAKIDILFCVAMEDHFTNGLKPLKTVLDEWTGQVNEQPPAKDVDELILDYIRYCVDDSTDADD